MARRKASLCGARLRATAALLLLVAASACADEQMDAAAAALEAAAAGPDRLPVQSIVGGVDLPDDGFHAPWQAEIYSTYQYTDADVAADSALPDSDPAKAHLAVKADWERRHRCGGVYVGGGWVLTAAHCVTGVSGDFLRARRVRLGIVDLARADPGYAIETAVVHRGYEEVRHANDIALLKVAIGPRDPAKVKPLPLVHDRPGDAPLAAGDKVTATGWGATAARAGGPLLRTLDGRPSRASARLKQVTLAAMPAARCASIPEYRGVMSPTVVCAGSDIPGHDACTWDSGGPLVRSADTLLVGLVSWGKGCGLAGVPGIYTRVAPYKSWIDSAKRVPAGRVTRL